MRSFTQLIKSVTVTQVMAELYVPAPDQFETERSLQPKRVVGEYVESAGFLVPQRFSDIEEARHAASQGIPVLARSEHPDEYSGPSGLGKTSLLVPDESGVFNPRHNSFSSSPLAKYGRYASAAGLPRVSYMREASESYWEAIPGTNITVVADDAVEGRYHVFAFNEDKTATWAYRISAAIVTEDGSVERQLDYIDDVPGMSARYEEVIDFYNRVRRLERFNGNHCPIIEMQLSDQDDQLYFLQYHRTRDEAFVSERIDVQEFPAEDGWLKADAVRGAHIGEKTLELALWYPNFREGNVTVKRIELPEDGSTTMDCSFYDLDEFVGRQRTAHVLHSSFDNQYSKIASAHGPRSQMFKPKVTVLLGREEVEGQFVPKEMDDEGFVRALNGMVVRIATEVVSDGRNAFVRYGDELILS
jgi:hypothetical protein